MTIEDYDNLCIEQDYKCAICNTSEVGRRTRWLVDHDHTTGRVRGLLCHNCNVLLGHARDDISILSKAIEYLKENN